MPEPTCDGDLLEGRALDRREELQRRERLAAVEVRLQVLDAPAAGRRAGAAVDEVRPVTPTASVCASQPFGEATKARNCFALVLVLAALRRGRTPAGSQVVMPALLASSPGMAKKPSRCRLSGKLLLISVTANVSIG